MKKTPELYDQWNIEKKKIDGVIQKLKRVEVGEIWICKIGINIGGEISKDDSFQRPVLVVANYLGGDLVAIIPMSTKYKENYHMYYYEFPPLYETYGLNQKTYLVLNQFKVISTKRLVKKINNYTTRTSHVPKVDAQEMKHIKNLIKQVYKIL